MSLETYQQTGSQYLGQELNLTECKLRNWPNRSSICTDIIIDTDTLLSVALTNNVLYLHN